MEDITLLFLLLGIGTFILTSILRDKCAMPLRFFALVMGVADLAFTMTDTTIAEIDYGLTVMIITAFLLIVYQLWMIVDAYTGKK